MKWFKFSMALVLSLATCSFGWAQEKSGAAGAKSAKSEAKEEKLELADGKIIVMKPANWKNVPPKSNMLQYEFRAPAAGEKSARITISSAGGSISQNIDRWIGQFEGIKKEDVKTEQKEIEKTNVHIVDLEGTFKESMGGPFAPGGQTKKLPDYRMIGIILDLKDEAKVFIKVIGPKEVVADLYEDTIAMVEGLKNK